MPASINSQRAFAPEAKPAKPALSNKRRPCVDSPYNTTRPAPNSRPGHARAETTVSRIAWQQPYQNPRDFATHGSPLRPQMRKTMRRSGKLLISVKVLCGSSCCMTATFQVLEAGSACSCQTELVQIGLAKGRIATYGHMQSGFSRDVTSLSSVARFGFVCSEDSCPVVCRRRAQAQLRVRSPQAYSTSEAG